MFGKAQKLFLLGVLWLGLSGLALAQTTTLTIRYGGNAGSSGVAVLTVNNSLLAPNSSTGFNVPPGPELVSLDLTLSGLSAVPTTTSFTKANLTGWLLNTDAAGQITDINFWTGANGDGYAVTGVEVFSIDVSRGQTLINSMTGALYVPPIVVPTLNDWMLLLLALMVAGAAVRSVRRRVSAGS